VRERKGYILNAQFDLAKEEEEKKENKLSKAISKSSMFFCRFN
jgi:DNA-binding winged helix-turn-helix (wHTH) protein